MKRLVVVAAMAPAWLMGCVANEPVDRLTCPIQPRVKKSRPTHRVSSVPRTPAVHREKTPVARKTWYPHGIKISPRWTTIVIHHSATEGGGAKTFQKYHQEHNGWDELGYHFVIGNGTGTPDGLIEVGPRWHKQKHGAHCKTSGNYHNEHGIGICLVGDFTSTRPTPRQLGSLRLLVRFLMEECAIRPERITTHSAVTGKTSCPGRYFSLEAFRRSLDSPAAATSLP